MSEDAITLDKDYVVRHWLRVLRCSERELIMACKAVGNDPAEVRRYLDAIPEHCRDPIAAPYFRPSQRAQSPQFSVAR